MDATALLDWKRLQGRERWPTRLNWRWDGEKFREITRIKKIRSLIDFRGRSNHFPRNYLHVVIRCANLSTVYLFTIIRGKDHNTPPPPIDDDGQTNRHRKVDDVICIFERFRVLNSYSLKYIHKRNTAFVNFHCEQIAKITFTFAQSTVLLPGPGSWIECWKSHPRGIANNNVHTKSATVLGCLWIL